MNEDRFSAIITWNDDGNSFAIKDLHLFTNTVLPQYYKHKNFSSFVRQLNMYGFHKLKENALEFVHPLFQKGNFEVLKEIHRKNAEFVVKKDEISEISERLKVFQDRQEEMAEILEVLGKEYENIVEQNKVLVEELFKSKQRERNIEMILEGCKRDKIKNLWKLSQQFDNIEEDNYYEKLSPL